MVHLLQVSVILSALVLVVVGGILVFQYYNSNASENVENIVEIISGNASGGANTIEAAQNETAPITLPSNVQILQNDINNTRYTAILITENLTQS